MILREIWSDHIDELLVKSWVFAQQLQAADLLIPF